ncbi:PDR/VanB family oxidoreductase [Bradyrhizobium sp. INPA03-11B]|uniref:PDR/VanB family oxidoreductase n=1 Tax=Bradyrhizobium sp. INPA03-11B TaxID=418598 RepID=UPI00338DC0AA
MRTATLTAVVDEIRGEAADTISIGLRPVDGDVFPSFDAGAHIDVHLPNGIVRSYSLVNPPHTCERYVLGVLRSRDSRGGSAYIHDHLREGDRLAVSAPRNNFPLDETGGRFLLVAGGIGVTAIYCMAQRLVSLGKDVEMLYCSRTRGHAAWLGAIQTLGIPLTLHFDSEQGGPPDIDAFIACHGLDTRYYCCGPSPMLIAFEQACERYGYSHAHVERFAADPSLVDHDDSASYDVHLANSGKLIRIEPGTRLLDALLAAGVEVPFSCREGICGSCEMTVLEGAIDHRDSVLTDAERAEGKSMMVCVSGCRGGRLVLDC